MAMYAAAVAGTLAGAGYQYYEKIKKAWRKNDTEMQLTLIDARVLEDRSYWTNWFLDKPGIPRHLPYRRALRLLSLDGGGVRGIMSLIILQKIMQDVAPNAKPCEYFDLIGGTSTGGLIAIMLGRLRMDVEECIATYAAMAQEVFQAEGLAQAGKVWIAHKFSAEKLEAAVKKVVGNYQGTTSSAMWDNPLNRQGCDPCKTFVVAIPGCNVPRPPKLFRTYNNRFQMHSADKCEIWEAARATSCAPSFFPDVQVEGIYYSDGGLGYNNPTQLVLQEARSLWGITHPVSCLLSIGTGSVDSCMHRLEYTHEMLSFVKVFEEIALSCERVHQELKHDQFLDGAYYRFNPTMTEKIELDEWRKMTTLKGIAWEYLANNDGAVASFAGAMRG